jgi:hypothetical protein
MDVVPALQQPPHQMASDKTGGARDKDFTHN